MKGGLRVQSAAATGSGGAAERLYALLSRLAAPRARRLVIMGALCLLLPTLAAGLSLDDYLLLYELGHPDSEWIGRAPFTLFSWFDPEHVQRLIDGQGLPWWTYAHARCTFLRPLASLSHVLDYRLFGSSAPLMHLHNLLWFALLLALTAKLYAALCESPWVAGFATAMFAFDSAHGEAIGWICDRNALMGASCGVLALLCHQRWRSAGRVRYAWFGCVSFACGLLSAELTIGALAYLVAYTLFLERAAWRSRLLSIAPYALVFIAWGLARSALQLGSYGLGGYTDPVREPLEFARNLPQLWTVLLASQVGRLASDFYALAPDRFVPLLFALAVVIALAAIWFVWPSLRARASSRFWASGAALSLLPLAATVPSDRLLALVGLGVMPCLAQAIGDALQPTAAKNPARARLALAFGFTLLHLAIEPFWLPVVAFSSAFTDRWTRGAERSLPSDPAVAEQSVIVAAVPDSVLLTYLPVMRSLEGKPRPHALYWLMAKPGAAQLEQRGPNTLRVSAPQGLFDRRSEARGRGFALRPGDRVALRELTVHVIATTPDGIPTVCDFVFARALSSPQYRFQTWRDGRLQPLPVPRPGERVRLQTS